MQRNREQKGGGGGQKTGEREEMAVTLRDHRKRTWVDGKRGTRRQFDGGS